MAARPELHQLAALVAVADTGTMTAAAKRLGRSPTAVSDALRDLERQLRVALVVRERARGVRLTPTGAGLVDRARAIVQQVDDLYEETRGEGDRLTGPLRIGSFSSLGPTVLPALLDEFTAAHPHVRVDFVEEDQARLDRLLDAGTIDLAVGYDLPGAEARASLPLDRRRPLAVTPPGWAEPRAEHDDPRGADAVAWTSPGDEPDDEVVALAALAQRPLILLDVSPAAQHARELCRAAGFTPRIAYRVRTYETARSFVARGFGWAVLLQRPPGDLSYEGRPLRVRRIAGAPAVTVSLLWRERVTPSRTARGFVRFAAARRTSEF